MKPGSDIEQFYALFPEPEMARDLTDILEDFRIESRLKREYPALGDQINRINEFMAAKRPLLDDLAGDRQRAVEIIGRQLISGKVNESIPPCFERLLEFALHSVRPLQQTRTDIHLTAKIAAELYFFIDDAFTGPYRPVIPFSTFIDPEKVNHYDTDFGGATPSTVKKPSEKNRQNSSKPPDDPSTDRETQFYAPAEPDQPAQNRNLKEDRPIFNVSDLPEIGSPKPDPDAKPSENQTHSRRISFRQDGFTPGESASLSSRFDPAQIDEGYAFHATASIDGMGELTATPGTRLYPEWGEDIGCYRINWSRVIEHAVKGDSDAFYQATMAKYAGVIKKVKREFQMLRPEGLTRRKRQLDGEEIDLDAAVAYFIDLKLGIMPSEKNYIRIRKNSRDIAVCFLVDMSGSTRGPTITLEKEALIIMAEALTELGDVFSIYGFSGYTRNHVDFYLIKDFFEPYDPKTAQKISAIRDHRSTRIGPAIRHAVAKLNSRDEKIKMLILLSDGKPEDKAYEGEYGMEDTRMALKEGQQQGIKPFCITVDNAAPEYLHRMYSHSNWVVFNDVTKLPLKITRIYRRLTT
jgi:hypothetical protein